MRIDQPREGEQPPALVHLAGVLDRDGGGDFRELAIAHAQVAILHFGDARAHQAHIANQ